MRSVVHWFVDNPIAAKLIMLVVLIAGLSAFPRLDKEFFPQSEIDLIRVNVVYPGAGPAEVEQQICARIEEAVQDIAGIEEIRSTARESSGQVIIEIKSGEDTQRVLNDVKANVDGIETFPVESENPQIVELRFKQTVMRVLISGAIGERALKELGEQVREDIAALPDVDLAELLGTRRYEFSVEVSEHALRDYGLRFDEVANAIRGYSLNMPGGKIRDIDGDILVQTRAQAYTADDFANIVLRRSSDGVILRVGDVADVIDGFEDVEAYSGFNGDPSVSLVVYSQSNPNILKTKNAVTAHLEQLRRELPESVEFTVFTDFSVNYRGRLDTLIFNGTGGLLLVFAILLIFLRPSLAFWVCSGIAVAFLGSIALLSMTAISLNVISMFAFIMILGIVVDDAIIVGESVYSHQQEWIGDAVGGAVAGVMNVMAPVWFAVVSTMIFFTPFLFVGEGAEPSNMAVPVLLALGFSLFESLLLLPSHLGNAHAVSLHGVRRWLAAMLPWLARSLSLLEQRRQTLSDWLPKFAATRYRRLLIRCVANRLQTLLVFFFLFSFSIAAMTGGWLSMRFFPNVASDFIIAEATMPESASFGRSMAILQQLEGAAERVSDTLNTEVGYRLLQDVSAVAFDSTARVMLKMDRGDRPLSNRDIAQRWQEEIGKLSGVREFKVSFSIRDLPKPVEFLVLSSSETQLAALNAELTGFLQEIPGVINVRSSLEDPATEIELQLRREAETQQITQRDISLQVRRAFYGEEVQRVPQVREDVKVLVRYPRSQRSNEEALRGMYIRSTDGVEYPLESVADIRYVEGFRKIERLDRKRVARISADLQPGFTPGPVIASIQRDHFSTWQSRYPDTDINLEGEQKEQSEFVSDLVAYFTLAVLGTFGLMAVMLRSYWQPMLVLSAVPFGFMGAVVGHLLMGIDMSMFSLLGIMACAGVVVNDNVVLIDRINQLRRMGYSPLRSAVDGAVQRFRPIVLTSATTFFGLAPILFEQSVQAAFLKPMVVSLAVGVVAASFVTLCFVPVLYLAGERIARRFRLSLPVNDHSALAHKPS